jgi:hypothetical protein
MAGGADELCYRLRKLNGRDLLRSTSLRSAMSASLKGFGRRPFAGALGLGVGPASERLEAALGDEFTPAVRNAWAACYSALAGEMKAAAAEADEHRAAEPLCAR